MRRYSRYTLFHKLIKRLYPRNRRFGGNVFKLAPVLPNISSKTVALSLNRARLTLFTRRSVVDFDGGGGGVLKKPRSVLGFIQL